MENVKSLSISVTKFCDQGICEGLYFSPRVVVRRATPSSVLRTPFSPSLFGALLPLHHRVFSPCSSQHQHLRYFFLLLMFFEIAIKVQPLYHHLSLFIHRLPPPSFYERRREDFKLCGGFFAAAGLCCFGGCFILCLFLFSCVCFVFFLLLDDQRLWRP